MQLKTSESGEIVSAEKVFARNEQTGLINNKTYFLKSNGKIDWRAMIEPEYLVFNRQWENEIVQRYNKPLDKLNVSEVEDKYLLILLGGIKELADLRGFAEVRQQVVSVSPVQATATCHITWIPNFETSGRQVTFGDGASATIENTTGFGSSFLETIALNRAFVRAVRNFLRIDIVGQDEVFFKKNQSNSTSSNQTIAFTPNALLQQKCEQKGISFEKFVKVVGDKYKDKLSSSTAVYSWTGFNDIAPFDAGTLLEILKSA